MMRWGQLFKRKDLQHLVDELANENRLRRVLGPFLAHRAWRRLHHWRRHLRDDGAAPPLRTPVQRSPSPIPFAALGCVFAALCYAEFAAMAPVSRQRVHLRLRHAGRDLRLGHGWDLILEYAMACACVAAAWANYLNEVLRTNVRARLVIPGKFCSDPFHDARRPVQRSCRGHHAGRHGDPHRWHPRKRGDQCDSHPGEAVRRCSSSSPRLDDDRQGQLDRSSYGKRSAPPKLTVNKVIADKVKAENEKAAEGTGKPAAKLTKEEEAQVKVDADYVRAKLAYDRPADEDPTWSMRRHDRSASRRTDRRGSGDPRCPQRRTSTDPSRFDGVIADINKLPSKRRRRSWGLLGAIISPSVSSRSTTASARNYTPTASRASCWAPRSSSSPSSASIQSAPTRNEAINPQRDIPIAIFASLAICTVLYVLVAAVITGMEPY